MTTTFNFNVSDEFGRDTSVITEEDEGIYDNEAEMYVEVFKRFMRAVGFVEDTIEKYIPSEEGIDEDDKNYKEYIKNLRKMEERDDEECDCQECKLERIKEYLHTNTVNIPESTVSTTNNQNVKLVWTNPVYLDKGYNDTISIYTKDTLKGKK